jgi:hypothetical protein
MRQLTVEQPSASSPLAQLDLPLAGLPSGEYSVNIAAGDAAQAEEVVTIRVTN